ncbi:MAG: T9SS type A sorting domain-containing protein [Flavobacteriales bacterium]
MKKHLLLSIGLLTSFFASAQFIELSGETNTVLGTSSNTTEVMSAHWDVINISGVGRDVRCSREILSTVAGAEHQFCWGEICGPWGTTGELSTEIVTIADGDTSSSFYCKYRHLGNPGQSTVRFCWYDPNDGSYQLCYDVNFCVDQACIITVEETTSAALWSISPNPLSDLSALRFSFPTNPTDAHFVMYDQFGRLLEDRTLTNKEGIIMLDGARFENGIYFCQLIDSGVSSQVQRLVVSK